MTHGWLQFAVGMTAIIIAIYGVLHLAKLARIAIRGLGSLAVATLRVAKAIAFVPLHVGRVFRTRSRARRRRGPARPTFSLYRPLEPALVDTTPSWYRKHLKNLDTDTQLRKALRDAAKDRLVDKEEGKKK